MNPDLHNLTQINIADMCKAFGLPVNRWTRSLFAYPAHRFAQQIWAFDRQIPQRGLATAALLGARGLGVHLRTMGTHTLPRGVPTLFLANHPGLTDTLALFAAIPHTPLYIIAGQRPFLACLPQTSQQLIYVDEAESATNLTALREGIGRLNEGHAILTFPAGKIEPDPALYPQRAQASLTQWSPSIDVFGRLVPELHIIPTLISGVFHPQAQKTPLRYLHKDQADRDWLAAILQLINPLWRHTQVVVQFGLAIKSADFPRQRRTRHHPLTEAVRTAMNGMIAQREREK